MSKVTAPPAPANSQLALPLLDTAQPNGAVFLGWGLRALQRFEKDKRDRPRDPCPRTMALPLFGVQPGANWREHSAKETKFAKLPPNFLELRRNAQLVEWTSDDHGVRAEIRARTVTMSTAMRWKAGAGLPPWFVGFVPRKLRALVSIVWTAYCRRAFGVRDTQNALAAVLGCHPRTVRNLLREGERLGLISSSKLWTKLEGKTMRDVLLLRPGAMLETIAGLASFQFQSKIRGVTMRVAFPGELRAVVVSKKAAASRSASLRKAADRFFRDQRDAFYKGAGKLEVSPWLFAEYLCAELLEAEAKKSLREVELRRKESNSQPGKASPPLPADHEFEIPRELETPPEPEPDPTPEPEPGEQPDIDFAALYLLSSSLDQLAGDDAAPRRVPPPGDGPSVAEGVRVAPARANRTSAPLSSERKKVPNIHALFFQKSATTSDVRSRALTDGEGISPPSATDGPSPGGGTLRGAASSPASWSSDDATKPPGRPEPAGAAPRGARGVPAAPAQAQLGFVSPCDACNDVGMSWQPCPLCGKGGS